MATFQEKILKIIKELEPVTLEQMCESDEGIEWISKKEVLEIIKETQEDWNK